MADQQAKNPYGKAPKGESADARKSRTAKMYSYQRKQAESRAAEGDADAKATEAKIYKKLGKEAPSKGSENTGKYDNEFLGLVASTMGLRLPGAAKVASGGMKALTGGVGKKAAAMARTRKLTGEVPRLPGGARKALTGGKEPTKVGSEPNVTASGKATREKRMGPNLSHGPKRTYGTYKGGKASEKGIKQANKSAGSPAKYPAKGRMVGKKKKAP